MHTLTSYAHPSMNAITVEIRVRTQGILKITNNTLSLSNKQYTFSHIYDPSATNQHIFERSIIQKVEAFLAGQSSTVLAYGQTGSGKTYTMGIEPSSSTGMVPLTLEYLFTKPIPLSCTFVEIYNEEVIDLLGSRKPLSLRESMGEAHLAGLKEVPIPSLACAKEQLHRGCMQRTTKATRMNLSSSRSHAIFTLKSPTARLSFVDLAGSERLKRAAVEGAQVKESISINTGLLALSSVISALSRGSGHVPFRDSKLTRILQPALSGAGSTLVVACVSGCLEDAGESGNTLKYANRAANIRSAVPVFVGVDEGVNIEELRKEVVYLRRENMKLRSRVCPTCSAVGSSKGVRGVRGGAQGVRVGDGAQGGAVDRKGVRNTVDDSMGVKSVGTMGAVDRMGAKDTGISMGENISNRINTGNTVSNTVCNTGNTVCNTKTLTPYTHTLTPHTTHPYTLKRHTNAPAPAKRTHTAPSPATLLLSPATAMALYKDSLLCAAADGSLTLLNCNTLSPTLLRKEEGSIKAVQAGECIFYACKGVIKVIDGRMQGGVSYTYASGVSCLEVVGTMIYAGHEDGRVTARDTRMGVVHDRAVHRGTVFAVCSIGERVYSGSRDHAIGVLNTVSSTQALLRPPHYDSVHVLLGYRGDLLSAGRDCSIKRWSAGSNAVLKTVPYAHETWIKCGCVAEGWFCTGSKDGAVRLWDFREGSLVKLGGVSVKGSVNCVAGNGDGVFVGSQDRNVYYFSRT